MAKVDLSKENSITAQTLARAGIQFVDPLDFVGQDAKAFMKTLVSKQIFIQFLTDADFVAQTDSKSHVWMDGNIAQDENLPLTQRADIIKGVLLDEMGHILYSKVHKNERIWHYDRVRNPQLPRMGRIFKSMESLLEDHYIVRRLIRKFPGFQATHFEAVKYYLNFEEIFGNYEAEVAAKGYPKIKTAIGLLIYMVKGDYRIPGASYLNQVADKFDEVLKMRKHEDRLDLAVEITELFGTLYTEDASKFAPEVEEEEPQQEEPQQEEEPVEEDGEEDTQEEDTQEEDGEQESQDGEQGEEEPQESQDGEEYEEEDGEEVEPQEDSQDSQEEEPQDYDGEEEEEDAGEYEEEDVEPQDYDDSQDWDDSQED